LALMVKKQVLGAESLNLSSRHQFPRLYLGLAEKVVFKPDQESISNACK